MSDQIRERSRSRPTKRLGEDRTVGLCPGGGFVLVDEESSFRIAKKREMAVARTDMKYSVESLDCQAYSARIIWPVRTD
jgi:hypothetical protein